MPDNTDKKSEPVMVRASDLVAVKKQLEKMQEKLAKAESDRNQFQSQLKIAKTNLDDDDDVKAVRKMLVDQAAEIDAKQAELDEAIKALGEKETDLSKREKVSWVKTLATEHGVEEDAIKDADDPEKEALRLKAERLSKEIKSPAEDVLDSTPGSGIVKKQIKDMTDEEFAVKEAEMKAKALAR